MNESEPDCYGDGNVYRGVRSKDSEIQTITYTTPQTKPLSDEEIPYLHILQNAHTVSLGSEIWQSDEELQKYKKIIVATVRAIEAKVRGDK